MNKRGISGRIVATGLVVAMLLSGCGRTAAIEADAPVSLGVPVEVEKLQKTSIQNELTYIGQVQPQKSISVISKLSAEVMSVNFDIGDTVNAGDVLFTVDASDIRDQIRQLEAAAAQTDVAVMQAEYGLEVAQEGSVQERLQEIQYESAIYNARFGTQSADKGKETAKQAIDGAEVQAEVAYASWKALEAVYEEMQFAYDNGLPFDGEMVEEVALKSMEKKIAAAQAEYYAADYSIDQAKNAHDNAKIGGRQADKGLDLAYDSYDAYKDLTEESRERATHQAEFGVLSAEAAKNSTEVQLSIAQSSLGHAVVTSPISGVVSARNLEAGQMISPQALPFTIIQMDVVHIEVGISEALINTVQVGDEVQVSIQAASSQPFTGVVTAVSPAAGASSTYPIRIELGNESGLIKPGMFAQVSFVQAKKNDTFVVDKNVVLRDEQSQYVYVVRDGKAVRVDVATGLSNGTSIEILGGISANDEIIVVGQEYLYNDQKVNIVKRDGTSVSTPAPKVTAEDPEKPGEGDLEEEEDLEPEE